MGAIFCPTTHKLHLPIHELLRPRMRRSVAIETPVAIVETFYGGYSTKQNTRGTGRNLKYMLNQRCGTKTKRGHRLPLRRFRLSRGSEAEDLNAERGDSCTARNHTVVESTLCPHCVPARVQKDKTVKEVKVAQLSNTATIFWK